MANIVPQYDLGSIKDNDAFMRFCSIVVKQILDSVNGKLDFGNLRTQLVPVHFPNSGVNVKVSHNLNKVGVNFILVNSNLPVNVARGGGPVTNDFLWLQSSGSADTTMLLF